MENIQFVQISHNLLTDTDITSNEFRIYAYLLSLYNTTKDCSYPSLETISGKLNISLTTVKKSVKKLVDLGYMQIEKKKTNRGFYNTYKSFKNMVKKSFNKKPKKEKEEPKKPVDSNGCNPIEGQVHVEELLAVTNETALNENQVKQLLAIADTNKILEVYNYAKGRANNLFAFMLKAIKENWDTTEYVSAPVTHNNINISATRRGNYTSNNSKRFNGHSVLTEEQKRKAEDLERDLLGWYLNDYE